MPSTFASIASRISFLGDLLFAPRVPEPSYPLLPATDEWGESSLPGVYLAGEIAGTPLIKLGLNAGHELVEHLAADIQQQAATEITAVDLYDIVIVGAGAAGLGAAARAQEMGLRAVTLEANHMAETVHSMTKGKVLFAEPRDVPLKSSMWFQESTREQLLEEWQLQIDRMQLDVREFEQVTHLGQVRSGLLEVKSTKGIYRCRRVILSIGKAGNPRKAGVTGETDHARRIAHRLLDPNDFTDQRILIYGGGDVALEAALALCDDNEVTVVTIDKEFVYAKKRNIDALAAQTTQGKIALYMDSHLRRIDANTVTFDAGRITTSIGNDFVFEMIGAELPTPFLKRVGIKLENEWNRRRWLALFGLFALVYSFYSLKKFGVHRNPTTGDIEGFRVAAWPFDRIISPEAYDIVVQTLFRWAYLPFSWFFSPSAWQDMLSDRGFQQGYIYSLVYTAVMVLFGYEALVRWRRIARRKTYQTWRYLSLIGFQVAFFLIVNVIAVKAISVKYAWRAWGLYQPYPLFFNTFFWWHEEDPQWILYFFIGAGLLGMLVAIPLAARRHGKRFCTWICGCGGLAETLGDRWRHLAAKGKRSRAWEFQATAIFCASMLAGLVIVGLYQSDGNNVWWWTYDYLVDFWLVAVIPIALYPFFGGKVWCRYWCPLAAYNDLLAKWYGKLKITATNQCISCTQCSKYCQVGVDVMSFAKNQEYFDNTNSSCIHCGICIDVCPMDVLAFNNTDSPVSQAATTSTSPQ